MDEYLTDDDVEAARKNDAAIGIAGYLTRSTSPFCGRCGAEVPNVPSNRAGVVCWRCTDYLARLRAMGYGVRRAKPCPGCGGSKPRNNQFCNACSKKRRKESMRKAQRKRRSKKHG